MMDWSVVGIGVTLGLATVVWVRRRYFTRPELTLELKFHRGHSIQLGTSMLQEEPDEIGGTPDRPVHFFDAEKVLRVWEKKWVMELFIRNNSDHTAYYPKLIFDEKKRGFTQIEKLNIQVPIASGQEIIVKSEYVELEQKIARERSQINGLPSALDHLKICLEYKNGFKRTYYSIYDNRTKQTEFRMKVLGSFIWRI